MRYMMIVKGPENLAAFGPPPASLGEAIDTLIEEDTKSGKLVSFGGLKPTSDGARIRSSNGRLVTTDGPFTEAKEVIGGFTILNLASKHEALEEARKFMELHRIHWPSWEGEVEIRLMYEQEDDVRATQIEGSRLPRARGRHPRSPLSQTASPTPSRRSTRRGTLATARSLTRTSNVHVPARGKPTVSGTTRS